MNIKKAMQGFTLIELMIVVAIIGILSAIAIPAYRDYLVRTQIMEGLGLAGEMKTSVAEFSWLRGRFPDSETEAGVSQAASHTGNYVSSVDVGDSGLLTITYGNKVNNVINGSTLGLAPYRNQANGTVWVCGRNTPVAGVTGSADAAAVTNIEDKLLPQECRT